MDEETGQGDERTVRFGDEAVQAGFTQVPNAVLNNGRLSMQAKMAYIALASFAWGPKAECFPGNEPLAERMGCHANTVVKAKKEPVEAGLLEVRRRGLNKTNLYVLALKSAGTTPRVIQEPHRAGTKKTRIKNTRSDNDPTDHGARPSRRPEEAPGHGEERPCEEFTDASEPSTERQVPYSHLVEERVRKKLSAMKHTPAEVARVAEAMGVDDPLRLVDRSEWRKHPGVAIEEMLRVLYTNTIVDRKAWCAAFLRNGPRERARWPGGVPVITSAAPGDAGDE